MRYFKWFIAGFLSTLLFHQPVLFLMNALGFINRLPFSMEPTKPLGVPAVLSLAFWGGVWGPILGLVLSRIGNRAAWWTTAILFGAIAPTLVAAFVVAPLKGMPAGGGGDWRLAVAGFSVNAAWGLGTALLYLLMSRGRRQL